MPAATLTAWVEAVQNREPDPVLKAYMWHKQGFNHAATTLCPEHSSV